MNLVVLKGNVTRNPELSNVTANGKEVAVVRFGLAVNETIKKSDGTKGEETMFVECVAWAGGAEAIAKYVKKGDPFLVHGSLRLDTWEADGQKRSRHYVRVKEFEFLWRKSGSNTSQAENEAPSKEPVYADAGVGAGGDDIPF